MCQESDYGSDIVSKSPKPSTSSSKVLSKTAQRVAERARVQRAKNPEADYEDAGYGDGEEEEEAEEVDAAEEPDAEETVAVEEDEEEEGEVAVVQKGKKAATKSKAAAGKRKRKAEEEEAGTKPAKVARAKKVPKPSKGSVSFPL
jgi:hypothetical protein